MTKKYFCKVSWESLEQPLVRHHDNGILEIDWSVHRDPWDICNLYQSQNFGHTIRREGFVIDFMMEMPKVNNCE